MMIYVARVKKENTDYNPWILEVDTCIGAYKSAKDAEKAIYAYSDNRPVEFDEFDEVYSWIEHDTDYIENYYCTAVIEKVELH